MHNVQIDDNLQPYNAKYNFTVLLLPRALAARILHRPPVYGHRPSCGACTHGIQHKWKSTCVYLWIFHLHTPAELQSMSAICHSMPLGVPHVGEVGPRPMPRYEGQVEDAPGIHQRGFRIHGVSRAAVASAGGGSPRCPVFTGEEEPVGTAYQWKKEENALEERENVNCIFSLLISKLLATYALPVGD
jgi:hypothetical protein